MSLIDIAPLTTKEEKLNQLLDYLEEIKDAFAEIVEEYEAEDASEETVDLLTGALDAVEDAHDIVLDIVTDEISENP